MTNGLIGIGFIINIYHVNSWHHSDEFKERSFAPVLFNSCINTWSTVNHNDWLEPMPLHALTVNFFKILRSLTKLQIKLLPSIQITNFWSINLNFSSKYCEGNLKIHSVTSRPFALISQPISMMAFAVPSWPIRSFDFNFAQTCQDHYKSHLIKFN